MCPSERVALIEQKVRVSHVQGGHDHGPPLTERLAALKADDRMRRFVGRPVTLEESGTISNRAGQPGARRECDVHAGRERVALIVIEEKELAAGRFE